MAGDGVLEMLIVIHKQVWGEFLHFVGNRVGKQTMHIFNKSMHFAIYNL